MVVLDHQELCGRYVSDTYPSPDKQLVPNVMAVGGHVMAVVAVTAMLPPAQRELSFLVVISTGALREWDESPIARRWVAVV